VNPRSAGFNFSTTPLEKLAVKGEEQELWEVRRWWLRLHKDLQQFIDGKAAMQFVYVGTSEFVIFRDLEKPFFNTPTGQDCFPVRYVNIITTAHQHFYVPVKNLTHLHIFAPRVLLGIRQQSSRCIGKCFGGKTLMNSFAPVNCLKESLDILTVSTLSHVMILPR